jgi:phosphate-selective porin
MKVLSTLVCVTALTVATLGAAESVNERLLRLEEEVRDLRAGADTSHALSGVHLGGYGELHYNNLSGSGGASDKKEVDFHRFVLFIGHEFTDRIRFDAEVELEHSLSGDGKPGEVELEQAFVDFDLNDNHTLRGGLFLLPVGLINPTHEPPRFYGVERNAVENKIIPTTWWEAGVGAHGYVGDAVSYAAYLHSGLNTSSDSNYAVRSGRQKVAKADASDLAGTVALNWVVPGVTVGGSVVYQSDVTQGSDATAGEGVLGELHAELRNGPFGLRALYAAWDLKGDGPESVGADSQYGWYVEPSYRLCDALGVFTRYSEWDNQAGDASLDSGKEQIDLGFNWWPHEQVVVKADYQWQDNENGKDQEGFNLGIGYDF